MYEFLLSYWGSLSIRVYLLIIFTCFGLCKYGITHLIGWIRFVQLGSMSRSLKLAPRTKLVSCPCHATKRLHGQATGTKQEHPNIVPWSRFPFARSSTEALCLLSGLQLRDSNKDLVLSGWGPPWDTGRLKWIHLWWLDLCATSFSLRKNMF